MFRYAFDIYGFFLLGFLISQKSNAQELFQKMLYPVAIFCFLGVAEAALGANYPYKFICSPFPIYQGMYDLNSSISLSQDWRTRICITTHHPNTLSPILITLFFYFFPEAVTKKSFKLIGILGLLTITIYLCGSRAGMLCTAIFTALYFIKKLPLYCKIILALFAVVGASYGISLFLEIFNAGQGSSLDLRQQQLLFSYLHFMQSPVTGNGVFYMSTSILETDAYGDRVTDNSIGSLESFLFKLLIEFGAIGLFAQIIIIGALIVFFFKKRSQTFATQGILITLAFYSFLFLAGDAAGSMRFGYSMIGFCLGQCLMDNEDEDEENSQDYLESDSSNDSNRSEASPSL